MDARWGSLGALLWPQGDQEWRQFPWRRLGVALISMNQYPWRRPSVVFISNMPAQVLFFPYEFLAILPSWSEINGRLSSLRVLKVCRIIAIWRKVLMSQARSRHHHTVEEHSLSQPRSKEWVLPCRGARVRVRMAMCECRKECEYLV